MTEVRYLTAGQAAKELGVSLATLYAYVSRGMIRSEAVGRSRSRRYRAEDVRRLKERKERRRDPDGVVEGALHWGTPVMESGITLIADGRLYYRGRDVADLAAGSTVEEVAALGISFLRDGPSSRLASGPSWGAWRASHLSRPSRSCSPWPRIPPPTTCAPRPWRAPAHASSA
jgi:excisionase family DNA binding protein